MGKCQSQPSARDYAVSDEVAVAAQPSAETSTKVEEPAVANEKPCVTKQTLLEMPENAVELDENEQIKIFSQLLVKNLIVQESAAAEQDEKEEEMEIKSQALTVIKQVIQEGCNLLEEEMEIKSQAHAVVKHVIQAGCNLLEEEMEIESQALTVVKQVIHEGCQKIAGQPNVPMVIETDAQVLDDVVVKPDENIEEVKPSGPIMNDMNITEAKVVATPCPKCKGTGKTNLMGGARGPSFIKRQCKYCSSATAAPTAKGGA
jgi:hypothetical protein